MELLEEQIKITERIQMEAQEREQALMRALEKQERVFMSKLKALCETEPPEEEQEDKLTKRLTVLEMSFRTFATQYRVDLSELKKNQSILSNQLKSLHELLKQS